MIIIRRTERLSLRLACLSVSRLSVSPGCSGATSNLSAQEKDKKKANEISEAERKELAKKMVRFLLMKGKEEPRERPPTLLQPPTIILVVKSVLHQAVVFEISTHSAHTDMHTHTRPH